MCAICVRKDVFILILGPIYKNNMLVTPVQIEQRIRKHGDFTRLNNQINIQKLIGYRKIRRRNI
jgi:hypothetical protein